MGNMKRAASAQREVDVSTNIPLACHLTPSILLTHEGAFLCVLRLAGAAFECTDDGPLNNRHDRLNRIMLGLADPRITLWQHIVRRQENNYPDGEFPLGFAADLNAKYAAHVGGIDLMANELYLTVVFRPQNALERITATMARWFSADDAAMIEKQNAEYSAQLNEIVESLEASLGFYDVERLMVYQQGGALFSAPAEFYGFLVNGEWERVGIAACPLNLLVSSSRPIFGSETLEVRGPTSSSYAAMLGINAYPAQTTTTFLEGLLSVPCEIVVTQSFKFDRQDASLRKLNITETKMENAGDAARSQIGELADVADDLVSGDVAMGKQHYSVMVKADSLEQLRTNIALVRAILTNAGIRSAREDLVNEAAFWAQLPGNFAQRPRLSLINSRNACGFLPLHNFPMGRRTGNHWGDALSMLLTSGGTAHYLNLHASDPQAVNGGGKKDVAHTELLGPNGSGKTAVAMFSLCMMQKYGVTSILFSKDRDTEITVRALGGVFYPIKINVPTGWNPFSLSLDEGGTLPYLRRLVRKLVTRGAAPLTFAEEKSIDGAIDSVMRLDFDKRRLGRVMSFLAKGEGSIHDRLSKWCYSSEAGRADGVNAWVFDNLIDTLAATLGAYKTTGFDLTEFLDDSELCPPINMHLLHLTSRLIDGRRIAVFISEFWKALGDPQFSAYAKDMLKTLRKQNGFVVLDSQSPSDALTHPISRTLVEQVATLILFPNPGADRKEYMEGLGLSQREFDLIKTDMPEGQGYFLLKQGHNSLVLQLPLAGFKELSVLSARTNNIALMERLMAQHGAAPHLWLPHFYNERGSA